jgi:uncharacterized protein (DUF58 family)
MWFRNIFPLDQVHPRSTNSEPVNSWRDLLLSAGSLRQLNGMQLNASRYLKGNAAGLRYSLRRKPAAEFREHRMYVPGDDIRHVDWKASARQEHIFIKQGEHPKEASVYLLLDCSGSMAWGDRPKLRACLQLAAAFGFMALANYDRLMVVPLGRLDLQPLGFISGKGQFPPLLNYLRGLTFSGKCDLKEAIHDFTRRHARGGGLTLILSDLLGTPHLSDILQLLPIPTWDVLVFHLLHPEELKPSLKGDFEMVDVESGLKANYDINAEAIDTYQNRIKAWRERLELDSVEANAFYNLIPTDWSLDKEVIPHLRSVDVIRST